MTSLAALAQTTVQSWQAQPAAIPKHIVVAVSGGSDSVALLHVLVQAVQQLADEAPHTTRPALTVAHVHHGLRGGDADAEQQFVTDLAATLALPFRSTRLNRNAIDRASTNTLEATRILRHQFLRAVLADLGDEGLVALGHTQDDQLEHLWMRAQRQSGWRGQAAMPMLAVPLWRPLLGCTRMQLQQALQEAGQRWCDDPSNERLDRARTLLRHKTLPHVLQSQPTLPAQVLRFGDTVARLRRQLLQQPLATIRPHPQGLWLHWHAPQKAQTDTYAALATEWCNEVAWRLDRRLSTGLLARLSTILVSADTAPIWLDRHKTIMAGSGLALLLSQPLVPVIPRTISAAALQSQFTWTQSLTTVLDAMRPSTEATATPNRAVGLAHSELATWPAVVHVRAAQPGDRWGRKKLTEVLSSLGTPRPLWPWVEVVTASAESAEVIGVGGG